MDNTCLGCQRPFPSETDKVSIFDNFSIVERDKTIQKCWAYKIYQITGEDLTLEDSVRHTICSKCKGLLTQIYQLEQEFKNGYFGGNVEEKLADGNSENTDKS